MTAILTVGTLMYFFGNARTAVVVSLVHRMFALAYQCRMVVHTGTVTFGYREERNCSIRIVFPVSVIAIDSAVCSGICLHTQTIGEGDITHVSDIIAVTDSTAVSFARLSKYSAACDLYIVAALAAIPPAFIAAADSCAAFAAFCNDGAAADMDMTIGSVTVLACTNARTSFAAAFCGDGAAADFDGALKYI